MRPSRLLFALAAFSSLVSIGTAAEKLQGQASAYLREHQKDLVDWMPWNEEALARAKAEKKPIYVFIGATTSELTRAMHKQSFSNPQIAEALNKEFVCVLVDRDERVDLATLFQAYLQANKQQNGWPVNVWLTPDGKPFDGANYLPPSEEWGKEGVANVIKRVVAAWKASPDALQQKADEAVSTTVAAELTDAGPAYAANTLAPALQKAAASWLEHYDAAHGGFGDAPRFVEAELVRFLLRSGNPGKEAAVKTLQAADRGALHDPLDGGFYRRTIDAAWAFPSFQKTLGDQARLALAFLDAAKVTPDASFTIAARSAIDYALNRLAAHDGGFIHAEDATPDEIAAGHGWTEAEIVSILGEKDAAAFSKAYGVKTEGNVAAENDPGAKWKGKNILMRITPMGSTAEETTLAAARGKLLAVRDQRARALRDENVLVSENGLFLAALARAGQQLSDRRYSEAAAKLAQFLDQRGHDPKAGQLLRLVGGVTPGCAEDYTWLAFGLGSLNTASPDAKRVQTAHQLLQKQTAVLLDTKTGRFFSQDAQPSHLWMRPHLLDPVPGDLPSPESGAILAYLETGIKPADIPPSLLSNLMAGLNDTSGQPRGDVLLAAVSLAETKP